MGLQVAAHVSWTVLLQGCVLAKEAGRLMVSSFGQTLPLLHSKLPVSLLFPSGGFLRADGPPNPILNSASFQTPFPSPPSWPGPAR